MITQTPNPAGCNLASPGHGTYANVLCFADFTGFTRPPQLPKRRQQMKLSIADSPDFLQFCVIADPERLGAPQPFRPITAPADTGTTARPIWATTASTQASPASPPSRSSRHN